MNYANLDINNVTENKKFWSTVKPFFSDKSNTGKNIKLIDGDNIISTVKQVAETMNIFFSNAIKSLKIKGFKPDDTVNESLNDINKIVSKFKNHPSIIKIKQKIEVNEKFSFSSSSLNQIEDKIKDLNCKKPPTLNTIPAKNLINSKYIFKFDKESVRSCEFPNTMKVAEITPSHKKDDRTKKDNYRPVSILPSVSKIFEKNMYEDINKFMNDKLSPYLCRFREDYNTQYCLMAMHEKWEKALDNKKVAGVLLTDLSKAFDCLHSLPSSKPMDLDIHPSS